jgi:outer membrane receptor for ferrienterochelin and colicins
MAEGQQSLGGGQLKTHLAWLGEERNGGDQLHRAPDERQQSEWRQGSLWLGTLDYSLPLTGATLRTYLGATYHPRQHYTGFGGPAGFGYTYNTLINPGAQLSGTQQWKGLHRWVAGAEFQGEWLDDAVPGYGYAIQQNTQQWGFFAQDEWTVRGGHTFTAGGRVTAHNYLSIPLLTPNLAWKWNAGPVMTYRLAWGTGFRPPQLFGPDLHMAFAGGGVSRITIDPSLQKELSQSLTASADATLRGELSTLTASATAFYTALAQPFVIEERGTDSLGNQILVRTNGSPAHVSGVTVGANWIHRKGYSLEFSLTGQRAEFQEPQSWSSNAAAERMMLRTPQWYGYLSGLVPLGTFHWATTATLTGPMLVPHFTGAPGVPNDVLHTTPWMLDVGVKLSREFKIGKRWGLETWVAVINLFNQFQTDFDQGVNRDSNFIYGPARPRSLNAGFRLDLHP